MVSVTMCVCTFRRDHVAVTVQGLRRQRLPEGVDATVLVVDNDDTPSAERHVRALENQPGLPVAYRHAPGRNISIARNACLDAAEGDWIAFVDDDEVIPETWFATLWERAEDTGADVVFGPVRSLWPDAAPVWMRELDLHAPKPRRVNGTVLTGATNNTLIRRAGTGWTDQRFDLARGRTGGEDTEFFHRLRGMGAVLEIAEEAFVDEPVPDSRMSLGWLRARRFRSGQSHSTEASGRLGRINMALASMVKAAYSAARIAPAALNPTRWRFWYLRAVFHCGVVAGCFSVRESELYG